MKRPAGLACVFFTFFPLLPLGGMPGRGSAAGKTQEADAAADLVKLAWISGSWAGPSGETRIEEHWTDVGGNMLLGVGRTLSREKTVFFEFLRIEARPDGITT